MATCVKKASVFAASKLGYETLKKEQKEAVKAFVDGNDVFVFLPTGFRDFLCFVLLPYVFDYMRGNIESPMSIALCVSPLTSLVMDQRNKFSPRELRCEFLGEAQADPQMLKLERIR
jgi:bloom syndrome protein